MTAQAVQTFVGPLASTDIAALLQRVERDAQAELSEPATSVQRYLELRYQGQEHTLEIPVPATGDLLAGLVEEFNHRSEREYAFSLDAPLEVVAARVELAVQGIAVPWVADDNDDVPRHPTGTRVVDFDRHGGLLESVVRDRRSLTVGEVVAGPCVIEEAASTTLVLPGQTVRRDEHGNLVLEE